MNAAFLKMNLQKQENDEQDWTVSSNPVFYVKG